MILSLADIKNILVKRPNQKMITEAQKYTKKLLMHIKGVGLQEYIERINSFEKEDLVNIRKKYAVSNKPLFERLHRPKDNVFAAPGGSVYYDMPESKRGEFTRVMNNIVYGYTIKQWLKVFYMPAMEYDPMGLIFVEVDSIGNAYPTYKSIMDVFDYQLNGRNVEYVIFKTDKRITAAGGNTTITYRVVDDTTDRLVQVVGDNVKIISKETFPNYFMRVPASVISNIYDPVQGFWISADDYLVELADQFLQQGSIKNIYKNYFGFPRAWEYASACPECKGIGNRDGRKCDTCKGTGQKSRTDVSETLRLPVPQNKDQIKLAPDVAGYISPDIKGWDKMDSEMKLLEDLMFQTKWGTHQMEKADNNTATGKFIDVQPVNNALCAFSEAIEMMETFITNLVGEFKYGGVYAGASITYGKRFMLESPDDLWKKIQDGIKNGAPISSLYDVYNDYLQSRYSANALEMQKQMKLSKIEPLAFTTYEQLQRFQDFPQEILLRKYWFTQWMNGKQDQELTYGDLKTLQDDFEQYCADQQEIIESNAAERAANALAMANNDTTDDTNNRKGGIKPGTKKTAIPAGAQA